jgi:hypothetical protein
VALVLIGCSPAATSIPAPSTQTDLATIAVSSPVVQITQAEATQQSTPTADEAATSPGPTPTARKGLHATDPESVVLASGKPMLVEFFAFW